MDSRDARRLYARHANALAYIDVESRDRTRGIGSAFHVGGGVFVTARHVVEGRQIVEVRITEPVAVSTEEFMRKIMKMDVADDVIRGQDEALRSVTGVPPLYKHYLEPLELAEGPYFAENPALDVAVFRVREVHDAAGIVKLGVHWDDWVYRNLWQLSDAVVLGYPPIPMVTEPVLVAARADIHTFIVPRHAPAVHFLLSAMPRGGFSGGVAIHESGDALGVVTSSLIANERPEELGFFAVLSIEAIVKCLESNGLFPDIQREHHDQRLKFSEKKEEKGDE